VYARAEGLMRPRGMASFARDALTQAMHRAESDRLLLLPYDMLGREPTHALAKV
jgi:hypothetical protein